MLCFPRGLGWVYQTISKNFVATDEEERHLGHGKTDLQAATTASKKGCEAEVEKANLVIIKLNNKTKTKMPTQSEEFVFPGSLVR